MLSRGEPEADLILKELARKVLFLTILKFESGLSEMLVTGPVKEEMISGMRVKVAFDL